MSEWISVEDELPPSGRSVLIWTPSTERLETSYYWAEKDSWGFGHSPTHWIPIPEVPRGDAERILDKDIDLPGVKIRFKPGGSIKMTGDANIRFSSE